MLLSCTYKYRLVLILAFTLAGTSPSARAQHSGDVFVGRSGSGQMKISGFIPDLNIIVLPPVNGLFHGWAGNNPGFDRVINSDPSNDLYPMDNGASIRLVAISLDPALRAITPTFAIIDGPGESALLGGGSTLHIHLTWHINSDDPLFDPEQTVWLGTFKLIDTGSTGYTESAPFTFHFSNAECIAGDVNGDGLRNGRDIWAFMDVLADPDLATDEEFCAADMNLDGEVTAADIPELVHLLLSR